MDKNQTIKIREKVFYGMGNFGYGVISQTYNNLIMFFGTVVLLIPGSLMGLTVAITIVWDAFTDPIVGHLSDKQRSPLFGKRHGFMIIGIIGMAIFNILIWSVPSFLNVTGKFVWLLISMLALETFNGMFATPYTALGAEMSDDYDERTNIQAYKTIFFLISFLAPSVLMYFFLSGDLAAASQQGYMNMSVVTSITTLIVGSLCIMGTFSAVPRLKRKYALAKKEKKEKRTSQIFKMFFYSLKRKNYRSLVGGYTVSLISSAVITSVGLHLFTYGFYFGKAQISILMGTLVLATIISQPFWVKLSKKFEKKPSLITAIIVTLVGISVISATFIFRLELGATTRFALCLFAIFISGFGTGALYSLPVSMFADLMTLEYAKTKKESTGIYSGFMTFAYKMANAAALVLIGVLLDVIKFNAELTVQPISVQNGLGALAILGIAIPLISSIAIFSGYSVKRAHVEKASRKIERLNEVIPPIR